MSPLQEETNFAAAATVPVDALDTGAFPPSPTREEAAFAFLHEIGLTARAIVHELRSGQQHCQGHSFIAEALCRKLGIEAEVNAAATPYHFFCTAKIGDRTAVLDAYPEGVRGRGPVKVCWRYGNPHWQPYDNGDPLDSSDRDTGSFPAPTGRGPWQ